MTDLHDDGSFISLRRKRNAEAARKCREKKNSVQHTVQAEIHDLEATMKESQEIGKHLQEENMALRYEAEMLEIENDLRRQEIRSFFGQSAIGAHLT